jgi:putative ABC transport system substrate-binding protein
MTQSTAGGVLAGVKPVTSVTPVVFATSTDPVGAGFVASLARPGGNLTGLSNQAADHAAKRVELLRELIPVGRKLAVLVNPNNRGAVEELREVERAAPAFEFQTVTFEIQRAEDIAPALEAMKGRDALYTCTDVLVNVHRRLINTLALRAGLPTIHSIRDYVEAGGLMSYGASIVDSFRHAAEYVDKILRGAQPGDLPIQQPTKFELVINITTAKALGITVPPSLLSRADEVIE